MVCAMCVHTSHLLAMRTWNAQIVVELKTEMFQLQSCISFWCNVSWHVVRLSQEIMCVNTCYVFSTWRIMIVKGFATTDPTLFNSWLIRGVWTLTGECRGVTMTRCWNNRLSSIVFWLHFSTISINTILEFSRLSWNITMAMEGQDGSWISEWFDSLHYIPSSIVMSSFRENIFLFIFFSYLCICWM